ncbi:MAG TPA: alanine--tRNA ligase-related protein [Candidatus Bathyarchaeia archaeon]|nr:alanine--tRNA ligase-related protein [Candidatus Bathyarchaeia archaeon]
MTEKSNVQTERLYWTDSYVTEFEAKIMDISSNELILDKTAFYPFGGGQISDTGEIISKENKELKFVVTKVEINTEGNIIHFLSGKDLDKLHKNDYIIGRVDWNRRIELMKAHSSQHILSAFIEHLFTVKTMKAVIGTNETIVYLEEKITNEELQKAVYQTNVFLVSGKNITANFYDKKNIPKEINEHLRGNLSTKEETKVRVVSIDNLDNSLCGGTHCKNTLEIGIIALNDFKGDIIYYSHGAQALENISKMNIDQITTSKLLATKPVDINKRITKVLAEIDDLRNVNTFLSKKVVEYRMSDLKRNPVIHGEIKILKENFDYSERKFILQQLGDVPKDTLAIFIVKGPVLLLLSEIPSLPANELIQAYSVKTGNKGGGTAKIAQTAIDDSEKDLQIMLEIIEKKIENGNKKNS